jgi:hypothetical protein
MRKRITVFKFVLICFFIFSFCSSIRVNALSKEGAEKISKKQVINLIKAQGAEKHYYFDGLSYQLVNVDNDEELELIAQINGTVHIGNFFVFDKNSEGKYLLVAEKNWNVVRLNMAEQGDLWHVIKFNEAVDCTGGSGLDEYIAHLWYLKDGKFVEAWKGILKEQSAFQDTVFFKVGGYQYVDRISKLFAWSSEYLFSIDTSKSIRKPTTTLSIFKFDGVKFVLESEEKYEHDKLVPEIKFRN